MKISKQSLFLLVLFSIHIIPLFGQLKSGPMLGYSDLKEVMIWVQTNGASTVQIKYWEKGNSKNVHFTEKMSTWKDENFTAHLLVDEVEYGKKYEYTVLVNGKAQSFEYPLEFQTQDLWQYRKDPPNFSFAFGSCNYVNDEKSDRPGSPYGANLDIFTTIDSKHPDFMIWGGDNFYYREPDYTKTGMWYRNDDTRKVEQLAPLLAHTHQYAIWDDHDYGPNDADRSWTLKNLSLEVFKQYWANPNYVFENEGVTGHFSWSDVDFFLMDDRWFKAPNDLEDPNKDYFGEKQLNWLLDAMTYSKASFKIIVTGGQILNPAKVFENMANYEAERNKLLSEIEKRKIPGVLFLTGDRHVHSFWKLNRKDNYPLYEITASPLSAGVAKPHKLDNNEVLVPGTLISKNGFAYIQVSGPKDDRVMNIQLIGTQGELLWEQKLNAKDLK
jgi:alkaline phosphatase D